MATTSPKLTELALVILQQAQDVEDFIQEQGMQMPSFSEHGPSMIHIPPSEVKVAAAYTRLISTTLELHNLVKGPAEILAGLAFLGQNDTLALHAVSRLGLASMVPSGGSVSYQTLSSTCGVNERDVRRLVRHAATNHVLTEIDGQVAHTAASKLLADDAGWQSIVGMQTEEYFPSVCRTIDSLQKHGKICSPEQTAFSLANNTDKGLYEELTHFPERGKRFADAMAALGTWLPVEPIATSFNWAMCKQVVDVGGGRGSVSVGLARIFPDIDFIVQDNTVTASDSGLLQVISGVQGRVKFQQTDFFQVQPIKGADVYYFRAIFHNWTDEYCIKILKSQLTALKKGAHILIDEIVCDEVGEETLYQQRHRTSIDLTMLTYVGGGSRSAEEWLAIVRAVDERLEIASINIMPLVGRHLIDIQWTTDKS